MENILAVIGYILGIGGGGGALVYFFTLKAKKRVANSGADKEELNVALQRAETIRNIESINLERIDTLLKYIDEKSATFIHQKTDMLNLKIQLKECEEKIKLLEKDFQKLKHENDTLKVANAELKEKIKLLNSKI